MPAFESFRAARWIRTVNLILQAVLFLTLCLGLNYIASNHVWRADLTRDRRYSLSPETHGYLERLDQPIEVIVTLTPELDAEAAIPALDDIIGLLNEYVHLTEANETGKISVREIDVYLERALANELQIDRPNLVVFRSGDRRRAVAVSELHRERDDGSRVTEFLGESLFTQALLEVSTLERKKAYFLVGNGERRIDDTTPAFGLSAFAAELALRNLDVETLDLTNGSPVPADAAVVVSVGPNRVANEIQEQLRQYLNRSPSPGSIILMLRQGVRNDDLGLNSLLSDWGITAYDNLVVDADPRNQSPNGDLIVRAVDPDHPVTEPLVDQGVPLVLGPTRSLLAVPGRATGSRVEALPVAATSALAWGETRYREPQPAQFNENEDQRGFPTLRPENALAIAVASERVRPSSGLAFSVPSGRLLVVGTDELATNRRLVSSSGNFAFALNAVTWAVGREVQLNLPARAVERFQISLSRQELNRLRFSLLFGVPGAVALLGLLVYWTRRK